MRIRDRSLATRLSDKFMYFSFDVKMNFTLNYNSSEIF